MKKLLRLFVTLVILAALAGGGYWGYKRWFGQKTRTVFKTETAERADLASTISATGTVEPEELVNVGAQVSGKIAVFGEDANGKSVDYGSQVRQGMVLARIDDAVYGAEMRAAEASKLQAEANIKQAKANIDLAEAQLLLAKSNWERAQTLQTKDAMSKSDYDSYKAEYDSAVATISVRRANLAQAEAELASAQASYDKAKQNYDYCIISSPVDGVIIDRRVSVGQTVVSSMSASSIFLIAKDLTRMQVWVSVNEADIGQIKPGMPVVFTVDAFPNESFTGQVHRVRLNATMSQNVVTYVVEVSTDNSSGRLLPYLTANVKFILAERKNALAVSNAALRYLPADSLVAPEYREMAAEAASVKRSSKERFLWVLEDGRIRPLKVTVGLNDGVSTEIVSGDLREGMEVVTGATQVAVAEAADAPVVIVHLTNREALDEVAFARARGQRVYVETCPQYLALDDGVYYDANWSMAARYVCAPPIRAEENQRALWRGLRRGEIQTISTDHCSFTLAQKDMGREDFTKIPGGLPGVETRGEVVYTRGVAAGRMTVAGMCRALCENPAKLYGLYPRKGVIAAGSDADIVVYDPKASHILSARDMVTKAGYTPFEGLRTEGGIAKVYLRGSLMVEDGRIVGGPEGQYLRRGLCTL